MYAFRLADATALSEETCLGNNTQVDLVNRSIDLVNRSINPDFGVFDGEPSSSSGSDTDCSETSSIIRYEDAVIKCMYILY